MGDHAPEKAKEHAVLKKMGMVGVGVTAGLLAAAPFASATECPDDGGHGHGGHSSKGFDADCDFTGGNAGAASDISGDSVANAVTQAPIAGNNIGNIADCSSFLNGNLNGNFSGNNVALVGSNYAPDKVLDSHKLDSHKLKSHKLDSHKLDSHKLDSKKVNGKSGASSLLSF